MQDIVGPFTRPSGAVAGELLLSVAEAGGEDAAGSADAAPVRCAADALSTFRASIFVSIFSFLKIASRRRFLPCHITNGTTTASHGAPGRPMRPAEHQSGSYGRGNGRYCPTAGLASTATARVSLIGPPPAKSASGRAAKSGPPPSIGANHTTRRRKRTTQHQQKHHTHHASRGRQTLSKAPAGRGPTAPRGAVSPA